ncbi:MAG: autotransporter assembly complex protein TamA [Endozoicomonas sp.]
MQLRLEGLAGELRDNTELHLETLHDIEASRLTALEPDIRETVTRALQALGYYQPDINIKPRQNPPDTLVIQVSAGKPVRVRSLHIDITGEAIRDRAFQRLLKNMPLQRGDVLNHGQYEAMKTALTSLALNRGYFDARLTRHTVAIDVDELAADIRLSFESGVRYRFGRNHYGDMSEGTIHLLEYLLTFQPGQPYKAIKLGKLNRDISSTGYFSQIDVHPMRSEAENHEMPIYINVIPDRNHQLELGAGFSTDEGPRFSITWDKPWVNDRGQSLTNELRASEKRVEATSVYKIPVGHPLLEFYNLQLDYQYKDVEDTESNLFAPSIHRWSKKPNGWDRDLFFRLHYEDFRQGQQQDKNFLLIPGITLSRRRVRGELDPHWGDQQMARLELSNRLWGSDTDFMKLWGRSKWLRSVAQKHRFLWRIEQGVIFIEDVRAIPPSIRFFTGGDQTVRGYDYESISPRDNSGKLTGARYMTAASAEYEYQFAKHWRTATFIDAGTATNEYFTKEQNDWKTGVGVGLRWITPLGPLKVDLAFAVSEKNTPWRIHFSIGPDI